jgi:hypothetical protein
MKKRILAFLGFRSNPTFERQYQKIVSAYYKETLNPFNDCGCFNGTLFDGKPDWAFARDIRVVNKTLHITAYKNKYPSVESFLKEKANSFYSPLDIYNLEFAFLEKFKKFGTYTEDELFNAMLSGLEKLREIHESKGEVVKDYNFTKRKPKELTIA